MPSTIDNLDQSVYTSYALRTIQVQETQAALRLNLDSTIPPQIQLLNVAQNLSEMDRLLGVVPLAMPWAFFYPPKAFTTSRRSPFSFFRMVPTMGSLEDQQEFVEVLEQTPTNGAQETDEKGKLLNCFGRMGEINSMFSYIIGRVGQFLQG